MINTQYIQLNMVPSGVMPILNMSQYDIGRPLGLVVYNGGESVDLDTYTCTIEATRTDGTTITANVTTDDNIGVFVTTATMTNKADTYGAQLVLFDSNSRRVASLSFMMHVIVAAMDENAESIEEDASLYQQYTASVQSALADIREDISDISSQINTEISNREKLERETESVRFYFPDLSGGSYSGSCSLVTVNGKAILFDTSLAADWTLIKNYLDGLYADGAFMNIDYIVISHYHWDHVGNFSNILATYPHEGCHVYLPQSIEGHYPSTADLISAYNGCISACQTAGVEYTVVFADTEVEIVPDFLTMELFNCSNADYSYYDGISSVYNNYCMVALLKIGNVYAMYPGDIQRAAQIRITGTRELPRLFLYAVHHHGIQNDDYLPYLEAIEPEFSIISTSHNRALVSAASSYSGNYLAGDVGSTGFSEYQYVCDKDAGSITLGRTIPKIGWYYSYIDYYVDNTYSGTVHDGTEEHPFTEINEAIMFVNQSGNLHYRIHVKGTATRYAYVWARDFYVPVEIIGYKHSSGGNVYPSVHGAYIRTCQYISFTNLLFDGNGRDATSGHPMVFVWASHAYFYGCTFDGQNSDSSSTTNGLCILESMEVYITSCTFKNMTASAIYAIRYGAVWSNNTTFENLSSIAYNAQNMQIYIRGKDTITNIGEGIWISGTVSTLAPSLIINASGISSELLAACSLSITSQLFYYSAAHPLCAITSGKVMDVLTGEEVTLS